MKICRVEFGDKPIRPFLLEKLYEFHWQQFGVEAELFDSSEVMTEGMAVTNEKENNETNKKVGP